MLQYLHEKVQGWLAWAVVGIVASTFVLFGASYYVSSRSSSTVKATVNGENVSRYAFDTTYRRLKQQAGKLNLSSEASLKSQALEQLILENVMLSAGDQNGFYISTQQAENAILTTPDFQKEGVFSSQRFQQLLSNNMFTQSDYLKVMTSGMLNNQVRFSFIATSFFLQNELFRYIKYSNQKRSYDYLTINPKKLTVEHKPSEEDLHSYYEKHQAQFKTEETVSLEYVLLSMKQERKLALLEAGEARGYYDENQTSYMTPARFQIKRIFLKSDVSTSMTPSVALSEKINKIKKALTQNSFGEVVSQYSDDLFSEKDSLAWSTLSSVDKRVAQVLLTLPLNQTSDPVFTDKGVEFIKVVAKQATKLTPFDNVKVTIERNLLSDKAQRNFQQKAEQLADLSYQNPDDLLAVSEPLSLNVFSSELAAKSKGFQAPLNKSNVLNAAFSDDVLLEHNNSQPIQLNDDTLVVLRIKQHNKSELKAFNSVKVDINQSLLNLSQLKKANSLAQSIKNDSALKTNAVLNSNRLKWNNVSNALRTFAINVDENINNFAFEISDGKKGSVQFKQLADGKVLLIKLESISDGALTDVMSEQRLLLNNKLASNSGIKSYDIYIQALKQQSKVKILQ